MSTCRKPYASSPSCGCSLSPSLLRRIRSERIGRLHGFDVWLVDGTVVRNEIDIDFVAGGNPARYGYVPEGEIWVEQVYGPLDVEATALHEAIECERMQRLGESYDDAHDHALGHEQEFRRAAMQARSNPEFGRPPAPGAAEAAVRDAGYSDLVYLKLHYGKYGPVQLFNGTLRGRRYLVAVGHVKGTDRLDVLRVKEEPQLPLFGKKNPAKGGKDIYDPRTEEVRVIRQEIYQSKVRKELGFGYKEPFRDKKGVRLDVKAIRRGALPKLRQLVKVAMFQMGTGVGQRIGQLVSGKQTPTKKGIRESLQRYQNPDNLLRNRQDYEETLAIARKSFFRVVPEQTKKGVGYFVWPMYGAQKFPAGFATMQEAKAEAARLNRNMNPLKDPTKWWRSPKRRYTEKDLAHWLPPRKAFGL